MVEELKVGIDASNLRNGGGLSHLVQLIGAADPIRHRFERITVWGGDGTLNLLPQDREWLELRSHPWLNRGTLWRAAWRARFLPRELALTSDLLFAPGGIIVSTDLPRVTMCRNMIPFEKKERQRASGMRRVQFELLRRAQILSFLSADGVIFLTEYARREVLAQLPRPPRFETVIPHGVAARFSQSPRPQRSLSEYSFKAPYRLFYASTVNAYKHQWSVVEAVATLRASGLPVRLDLAGAGSDAKCVARLQKALDKHDPERQFVNWLGPVPFSKMHDLYRKADAFVFASSCENLPNILLEAMSAGLPILSTNSGPMPDILGSKGFYFEIDSPGALLLSLERMIKDLDGRTSAAHDARDRAIPYSWSVCTERTFGALNYIARNAYKTMAPL